MRAVRLIPVNRVMDITLQALMHRLQLLMLSSRPSIQIPDRLLTDLPVPVRITSADLQAVHRAQVLLQARAETAAERR